MVTEVKHSSPAEDLSLMSLLSPAERMQLASAGAPNGNEWREFRSFVAARDMKRRPQTQPHLMAYTPGETVDLFHQPQVAEWHTRMKSFLVPEMYKLICFVPCAATKPWEGANRGLYKSYNQLRSERDQGRFPKVYFVTISEPLGVVPEKHWADFPPYENPGLFRNSFLRFGMTNQELKEYFGRKVVLPFDDQSYLRAIDRLGKVIANFAATNQRPGRRFVSFVEGGGEKTTHSDMLDAAGCRLDFIAPADRFEKRAQAREAPYEHLRSVLLKLSGK